jgi:O-antigen ligase
MIEPAPLLIALSVGVALLVGRLLSARASLPVGLLGAVVGALMLQVAAERLLGGLYPVGGTAWPAPLVGAICGERLTARIATDWDRGQRP